MKPRFVFQTLPEGIWRQSALLLDLGKATRKSLGVLQWMSIDFMRVELAMLEVRAFLLVK